MVKVTTSLAPGALTQKEAQDILDRVQLQVGTDLSDYPALRDELQTSLQEGFEECNSRDIDPASLIIRKMNIEWIYLNAFNKHRLGKMLDTDNKPAYLEEDNFPNDVRHWPLCSEVAKLGVDIDAAPIFQVPGTVEDNQKLIVRPTKETPTPVKPITKKRIKPKATTKRTATPKRNTGHGFGKYDKLQGAPVPWLALPDGNLTLAEITCFVPQLLKCWDIIDLLIWNGALSVTLAAMINHFRDMADGPIPNNTVYVTMKSAIKKRVETEPAPAYDEWSVSAHPAKPAGFDPASVSVTGYRTPVNYNKRKAAAAAGGLEPTIPFRDLKNGVKNMPSGLDALDLTRCVEHYVANPDEDWNYPQDFADLVDYLGGPATVLAGHQDAANVARYTSASKLNGARNTLRRKRDGYGRLLKKNPDSDDDEAVLSDSDGQSGDDLDFDALDDKAGFAPSTSKSEGKRPAVDDSDEDDFTPTTRDKKRKRPVYEDLDEDDVSSNKPSTKRPKKQSPKKPSVRKTQSTRSGLRNQVTPEDIPSDSDSDTYAGPKSKKKAATAIRTSGRSTRGKFTGSYNVEEALKPDSDEEDELAPEPKKLLTPAEIRERMKASIASKKPAAKKAATKMPVEDEEDVEVSDDDA
jgi:hypothetical protein